MSIKDPRGDDGTNPIEPYLGEMAERNAEVPSDRRIEFRMGINLGDRVIMFRGPVPKVEMIRKRCPV